MQKLNETTVVKAAVPAKTDATKDSGRVRYGSGCIQFADATPKRDATKDSGRVRYGSGCIQF